MKELPRQVNTWPRYVSIHVKCLFQACSDALLSSGTEPSVDNLALALLSTLQTCALANLRSYLLVQWFSIFYGLWLPYKEY